MEEAAGQYLRIFQCCANSVNNVLLLYVIRYFSNKISGEYSILHKGFNKMNLT